MGANKTIRANSPTKHLKSHINNGQRGIQIFAREVIYWHHVVKPALQARYSAHSNALSPAYKPSSMQFGVSWPAGSRIARPARYLARSIVLEDQECREDKCDTIPHISLGVYNTN